MNEDLLLWEALVRETSRSWRISRELPPALSVSAFLLTVVLILISPTTAWVQITPATDSSVAQASINASIQVIPEGAKPAPVTGLRVADTPDDNGTSLDIRWEASPDEASGRVRRYRVLRAPSLDGKPGDFEEIGQVPAGTTYFADGNTGTRKGFLSRIIHSVDSAGFFYRVVAVHDSTANRQVLWEVPSDAVTAGPASSVAQWFGYQRRNVLVGVIILCILIVYYINRARAGKDLFIRKIAGLEAVNDAVGRATEMGRKIFFIPGISDMDNVQTLAAVTILGYIAEMAALYDTKLDVPVSRSLVMVACRDVLKESYTKVGRPDAFKPDQVHYLTDDQFGYAAAIDGMVVREKPATIFLLGEFFAESLVLAETGNAAGAIQIAGTAESSQLPFFVAACDYTLIGEELFAASAYLSREPRRLGSLKGQDIGKGLILILIALGVMLSTVGLWNIAPFFTVIH